jgi:hypothetical protein
MSKINPIPIPIPCSLDLSGDEMMLILMEEIQ